MREPAAPAGMPDPAPGVHHPPSMRERWIALGHVRLLIRHPADPAALLAAIDPAAFAIDERIPYWAEVWPAAVALGRKLVAADLRGRRAIELGAGVGLCGLSAARAGAQVLVTDYEPAALACAEVNAALNQITIATAQLDWRESGWREPGWPADFDLVLAADVLYEARNVAPLAARIPELLAPGGTALLTDPGRPYLPEFVQALGAMGLAVNLSSILFFYDGRAREVTLITALKASAG
jgi:predicted nicotinamide N-methyase